MNILNWKLLRWTLLTLLTAASCFAGSLTFNLIPAPGMDPQAIAGFQAAATRWSAIFDDPITVNIDIGFTALPPGILGSTSTADYIVPYSVLRSQLIADATSSVDMSAIQNLPSGSSIPLLINRTAEDPGITGDPTGATPYLDNNGSSDNVNLVITGANARALGFGIPAASIDASITFSSSFPFDFDPSDGITAGDYDFVGVATHEIGHALGFISGVDSLDYCSLASNGCSTGTESAPPFTENDFNLEPLDLFRYSALSIGLGAVDFTADNRTKYFSLDGGVTQLADFSTGIYFGDGRQASHWKDNLGIGIMDPTAAPGELLAISGNDITALDAIGWTEIPEPGALVLCGGVLFVLGPRRRAQSRRPT